MHLRPRSLAPVRLGFWLWLGTFSLQAGSFVFDSLTLTVPDGFRVERVAGPPLVDRPIMADFDELGRLYVAESSGSNAPVEEQLEEKPHRIVRLEDTDGDGRFDRRVVFADRLMFPEGVLWHRESLLVSAPPVIWKLTDTDHDGVCDRREVWHDGETLTGCANDLHGPYLGPDGWIYWCKGAFAEQTYFREDGSTWSSRAAHIFRKPFESGFVEPVMTGGMDNPVEVVFSPEGERFFTTTFLQHPGGGRRDGIIHAVYGGVYGKNHGVLEGHPRTGDLMPVMTHLGPAAACALMRYESAVLGREYQGDVFATLFNMRKVTRHRLIPAGPTYRTEDEDFLVGDHIDFHPTDVQEAPDGSLLVIDTGGWYKLCCPTSQLAKPDVYGAIYRVRRDGVGTLEDPCGKALAWQDVESTILVDRLSDPRPMVWKRAIEELARAREVPAGAWQSLTDPAAKLRLLWALTRMATPESRALVRSALNDRDKTNRQAAAAIRRAALHSVSVTRDGEALSTVAELLGDHDVAVRRVAAEALGRLGDGRHVSLLLQKLGGPFLDRIEEHSLRYALIEIGDEEALMEALEAEDSRTKSLALATLHQLKSTRLTAERVVPWTNHQAPLLRSTAWEVVAEHPEWAEALVAQLPAATELDSEAVNALASLAEDEAIQAYLARWLEEGGSEDVALRVIERAGLKAFLPGLWERVVPLLTGPSENRARVVGILRRMETLLESAVATLQALVSDPGKASEIRLDALDYLAKARAVPLETALPFLNSQLAPSRPLTTRQRALAVVGLCELEIAQLARLEVSFKTAGPMVLERLVSEWVRSLEKEKDPEGNLEPIRRLAVALGSNVSLASLTPATVSALLQAMPDRAAEAREHLRQATPASFATVGEQKARLEQRLGVLPEGDVVRGQAVFNSTEAACVTCHAVGYRGGTLGPDLTRIGQIRSRRDLLEAILYPSASMVRSYETVMVTTREGRLWLGIPADEGAHGIELRVGPENAVTLERDSIAELRPSAVSLMPAGLDTLLSDQQLADLLAFLEHTRW